MLVVNRPQFFRPNRCLSARSIPRSRHPAVVVLLAMLSVSCAAQSSNESPAAANGDTKVALQELQSEVHELKSMVVQLQQETVSSREEISRLREELATERANNGSGPAGD